MAQTKFVFEGFAPYTNDTRLSEFVASIAKVFDAHRVPGFFVTQTGPYPDGFTDRGFTHDATSRNARPVHAGAAGGPGDDQRSERARVAAADFGGPEAEPEPDAGRPEVGGDRRDGQQDGDGPDAGRKPGRKPRSDAGKPRGPRGGSEASGPSAGQRSDDAGRAEGGGAPERDGDAAASEGRGRGGRRGAEADGRPGGGQQRAGRADGRDGKAAPVAAADEDWDSREDTPAAPDDGDGPGLFDPEPAVDPADVREPEDDGINGEEWCAKAPNTEWPDSLTPKNIDRNALSSIMADHYKAHGGKFRKVTFDVLWEACEAQVIADVPEKELRRVAKLFLKDAARYRFGIKPQVLTAPKG